MVGETPELTHKRGGRLETSGGRFDGLTLLLLLAQWALLVGSLSFWWLYRGPFIVHFAASTLAVHLSFTIWHEAAHRSVFKSPTLNNVVGVLGMFPYMTPFFIQKWIHLEHHKHLNDSHDPNLVYLDGSLLTLPLRYPRAIRYAGKVLANDPRTAGERISDGMSLAIVAVIYGTAFWYGVVLDLVLLWFVPLVVAKLVMDWYINYLPHIGLPADRFRGTRIVDVPWLTPLVICHNYHAIHHIWPGIPWHMYRTVFVERLQYLKRNRVPIEHVVFASRPPRHLEDADSADTLIG